jgi:hypothetical protein
MGDILPELGSLPAIPPMEELGSQAALLVYLSHRAAVYPVKHPRHTCTSTLLHETTKHLEEEQTLGTRMNVGM